MLSILERANNKSFFDCWRKCTPVAIDEGLPNFGMLSNWIKKYKEIAYNIVKRKQGCPTMRKVTK